MHRPKGQDVHPTRRCEHGGMFLVPGGIFRERHSLLVERFLLLTLKLCRACEEHFENFLISSPHGVDRQHATRNCIRYTALHIYHSSTLNSVEDFSYRQTMFIALSPSGFSFCQVHNRESWIYKMRSFTSLPMRTSIPAV